LAAFELFKLSSKHDNTQERKRYCFYSVTFWNFMRVQWKYNLTFTI